jgi:prepilin-type N-terminal cleavage/methylation domain-containing protein
MPTLAPGVARRKHRLAQPAAAARLRGFTLIEAMVALFIIGVMAATLSALPILRSEPWRDELRRLQIAIEAAGERAQVSGTPITIEFIPQAYRFGRLDVRGYWVPIVHDPLFAQREVSHLQWRGLSKNGRGGATQPGGAVNPLGDGRLVVGQEMPEFTLWVDTPAGQANLHGDITGAVRLAWPGQVQTATGQAPGSQVPTALWLQ